MGVLRVGYETAVRVRVNTLYIYSMYIYTEDRGLWVYGLRQTVKM